MNKPSPAFYILPALSSPFALVLFRHLGNQFVVRWNLETDQLEATKLFHADFRFTDISPDGAWLVTHSHAYWDDYFLILKHPFSQIAFAAKRPFGMRYRRYGGYWRDPKTLIVDLPSGINRAKAFVVGLLPGNEKSLDEQAISAGFPYSISAPPKADQDEWNPLRAKLLLHGWVHFPLTTRGAEWTSKPSNEHPTLFMSSWRSKKSGTRYRFHLQGHKGLLPDTTTWATWCSTGDLLVASRTSIFRYRLSDIEGQKPSFAADLLTSISL